MCACVRSCARACARLTLQKCLVPGGVGGGVAADDLGIHVAGLRKLGSKRRHRGVGTLGGAVAAKGGHGGSSLGSKRAVLGTSREGTGHKGKHTGGKTGVNLVSTDKDGRESREVELVGSVLLLGLGSLLHVHGLLGRRRCGGSLGLGSRSVGLTLLAGTGGILSSLTRSGLIGSLLRSSLLGGTTLGLAALSLLGLLLFAVTLLLVGGEGLSVQRSGG